MRLSIKILLLLSLFLCLPQAYSQNYAPKADKIIFNLDAANKKFDKISLKLSTQDLKKNDLEIAMKQLEVLQSQAKECVTIAETQLKGINELLKSIPNTNPTNDHKYLLKRKAEYEKHFSECRLFVFRSQEAITAYKDTIAKLSATNIIQRSTPIWEIPITITKADLEKINWAAITTNIGINALDKLDLITLVTLIILGLALSFYLRNLCKSTVHQVNETHNLIKSFLRSARTYIIPIVIFGLISLFFYIINGKTAPKLEALSYTFTLFFLVLGFFKFVCSIQMEYQFRKSLIRRFNYTLTWGLAGYVAIVVFSGESLSPQLIELIRTIYIIVMSFLIVAFCWTPTKSQHLINKLFLRAILKIFLSLLLIMTIVTECLGFHRLAIYLISSIIFTTALILTISIITFAINLFFGYLNDSKNNTAHTVKRWLGVKQHRQLMELSLIKFSLLTTLFCLAFVVLLTIWGVSENFIDNVTNGLINGFSVAGLTLIPSRIIVAIAVFAALLLLARLLSTYTAKHRQFSSEKDTQVAIASLITYIGFSAALILGLIAAGVSFTGLAIIAGALSVGIGLGLQNIANNFISGIILLLEKPIKPGDRVIVDNIEGFVKRIRIRSTQITTLAKEDVIVPNADLIAQKVTNYMFRDRKWRVVCRVGVAYGSDIDRVREVLLDLAIKNENVLQEPGNEPSVLFKEFGDSSLHFELWCIIEDVNKKYTVISELNFAINKAFKEHGITIAFPQRDIHIHEHKEK